MKNKYFWHIGCYWPLRHLPSRQQLPVLILVLKLDFQLQDGKPVYSVTYDGKTVLENSPLGFVSNIGDFSVR